MADLPPELLQQIFIMVKYEGAEDVGPDGGLYIRYDVTPHLQPGLHVDPNQIARNEEHPSYKSFRQVNSLWCCIATPLLFQVVILDRNIASWGRLEAICSTPHLAYHVKTVQVVTSGGLPYVPEHQIQYCDDVQKINKHRPNGGPCAQLSFSCESVRDRYRRWRDDEKAIAGYRNTETAPQLHLNLLSNLKGVETIGHRVLAVIKQKYDVTFPQDKERFWRHYSLATRREAETLIHENDCHVSDLDHFPLTLFFRALRDSGKSVQSLAIRALEEMAADTLGSRQPWDSLRCLEVNLGLHGYQGLYGLSGWFNKWKVWVSRLDSLEELSVCMKPTSLMEMEIFDLLSPMRFPRLRSLHLEHVRMTYDTLNTFLQAHKKTIQRLHIEEPHISADDWRTLRAQEKAEAWEAESKLLYLTDIYLGPTRRVDK